MLQQTYASSCTVLRCTALYCTVLYCTAHTHTHTHTHTHSQLYSYILTPRCTHPHSRAHVDADTKQIDETRCTPSFAFASLGRIPCSLYQYITTFLQWCVRNCIQFLLPSPLGYLIPVCKSWPSHCSTDA